MRELRSIPGTFKVKDSDGVSRKVSLEIDILGKITDVYCNLEGSRAYLKNKKHMMDDSVFVGGVMEILRKLGYTGESFDRAESGMQTDDTVILEGGQEFTDFAMKYFKLKWVNKGD